MNRTEPAATADDALPRVNGVAIARADEDRAALDATTLRRRAHVELLRQSAVAAGLLADETTEPGWDPAWPTEAATQAIEALLAQTLEAPEPDEASCRRWFEANPAAFAQGERVLARHVLFAVLPGVDVAALRARAEACLLSLRAPGPGEGDRFAAEAGRLSNCPSGSAGGTLGWLAAGDCAPEFARELFGHAEVGVLPRIVTSRHGLHVVEVLAREPGAVPDYEAVRDAVRARLARQRWTQAVQARLQALAEAAVLEHVEIQAAGAPA